MKWALVTGAGSGIGAAIAKQLDQSGYSIILVGRRPDQLEFSARELKNEHILIAADLTTEEGITKISSRCASLTDLTVLVNNAGAIDYHSFIDTPDEEWLRQFHLSVLAPSRLIRSLLPQLKKSPQAFIINVASSLGIKPIVQTSAYSAMKAAMVNWSKTLALELAPDHITVNCVCPGLVDTPIHGFHKATNDTDDRKRAHGLQPLGRMGQPSEIASLVGFLCSDASLWTTGSVFTIDGGISLN